MIFEAWEINELIEPTIFDSELARDRLNLNLSKYITHRANSKELEKQEGYIVSILAKNVEQLDENAINNICYDSEGSIIFLEDDEDGNFIVRVYGSLKSIDILLDGLILVKNDKDYCLYNYEKNKYNNVECYEYQIIG